MTLKLANIDVIDLARTYTADEFEELPNDGHHYELIGGKLSQMPPTGDEHGRILDALYFALKVFLRSHPFGRLWFTTGFKLNENNTLEPDLMFVVASRVPTKSKRALDIIPDLVVEVWSPSDLRSQREREAAQEKIRSYQEAGVRLIWAIYPDNQTVQIYEGKTSSKTLNINDTLEGSYIIPGFSIKVSELFNV